MLVVSGLRPTRQHRRPGSTQTTAGGEAADQKGGRWVRRRPDKRRTDQFEMGLSERDVPLVGERLAVLASDGRQ